MPGRRPRSKSKEHQSMTSFGGDWGYYDEASFLHLTGVPIQTMTPTHPA